MTVSTSINSVVYRGNGAATQFAVPFKVLDEDHLVVRRRVFATGVVEYTYVGTDYSYAGIGASSGTLTLDGAALDDDYELVIERIVPYTQDLDIVNAGGFYPETVENQLDLMTMGIQQLADLAERGVTVPVGEAGLELTRASERASSFFAFDAAGAFVSSSGTGNDPALRTDLGVPATGALLVGYDPANAPATTVGAILDGLTGPVTITSLHPTFADAVAAWATAGGTLLISADHNVAAAITATLVANQSYQIRAVGKRTVTYTGVAATHLLKIVGAAGASISVRGNVPYNGIVFDGANLVNRPFYIDNDVVSGANRDGLHVEVWGIWGKNAKMVIVDGDANGLKFGGGFESVSVECNTIGPVTRVAGLGTPGSQGSCGIQIFGAATANAKHITVRGNLIGPVTTEDAVGTADYTDMDGCLIFQNDEEGVSAPLVTDNWFYECAGRAIKIFAECGGPKVLYNHVFRSVQGAIGGPIDIDVQNADGTVQGNTIRYTGNANAGTVKSTPISIGVSAQHAATFPYYTAIIRDNLVDDDTGVLKPTCVSFDEGTGNPTGRHCVLENHRDTGTAKQLFKARGLGNSLLTHVKIDNVDCNVTLAATITDDTLAFLRVYMTRINNRAGSDKPIGMFLDETTPRSTNLGIWEIEHPTVGFAPIGKAVYDTGGLQVVGARGAALPADATDLATALTLVNAIKARMKVTGGHGLVAD